jgi:hypothetical protein
MPLTTRRALQFAIPVVAIAFLARHLMSCSSPSSSAALPSGVLTLGPLPPLARPLSFFVLGGSGRTGVLFLKDALERGHRVTALMRDPSKLSAELRAYPQLTLVQAQLHETDKFAAALQAQPPNVLVSMLASDPKPHDGLSKGTRSLIEALKKKPAAAAAESAAASSSSAAASSAPVPLPWLTISAWGNGISRPMLQHKWQNRLMTKMANFWFSKLIADFDLQEQMVAEAEAAKLLKSCYILPPFLTNGARTTTFEYGDVRAFEHRMSSFDTVGRADMSALTLKLAEQAAEGQDVPQWVAIRNP